ncbi:YopJ/AvrA family T3SS effector serine/threonine acetyltransferase [Bartonella taylorii]|uniref:YopJ/AvrA family T3SS effector serine/threonine acetyltransferase n=1 Tax=Bartonella taylorii TaxID=33046 RepID=UPI001ABB90AF|nr:YopJ/AvrA family T3SS effector serine/threonine acetyltransferase [Bartonella taylorii]
MKPEGSKDTAHSSSTTQEGKSADESLASLLARLEDSAAEKEEESVIFNREKLKDIISDLENDLADGRWMNAYYAELDLKMMPTLVDRANDKYLGLNLKLAMKPEDLPLLIKEAIDNGVQSSRYIVNTGTNRIHFAAIDHQTVDNKTSLLFFEPTTFNNRSAAMLGLRTKQAIQDCQLPDCYFSMVEMDIQRSYSECGIFSLALAKKLHIEAGKLTRMHQDNVSGVLCTPDTPLPSDKVDLYLPPKFYKHTQGARRLREYVRSNPEAEHKKVNKKDETLLERFERNLVETGGKAVSVSLHRKRVSEYKSLTI